MTSRLAPARPVLGRVIRRNALLLLGFGILICGLTAGAAWAYWSAESTAGGNGASLTATVGQGAIPSTALDSGGVTLTWSASTLSTGDAVTGYSVNRYDAATLATQTIGSACAGVVVITTCTETAVPQGVWVYSVTPVFGSSWFGAESAVSGSVTTDLIPPVNAISLHELAGTAFDSGSVVYYRGAAGGSFTLTNALSDSGSGPASSTTSALGGSTSGWSHAWSTVTTPAGGPYVSAPFAWAAGSTGTATEVVTGRDRAGNTVASAFSFQDDSTPPTPGSLTYPDGTQTALSITVYFTVGTDGGSGVSARRLERSSSALAGGVCGTFVPFVAVGVEGMPSPYVDGDVTDRSCHRYRYVVTDHVGNVAVTTSASVTKVDSGMIALRSASAFSILGGTGATNDGVSMVSGDLGSSPSSAVTGFPPGIVGGTIYAGGPVAAAARSDFLAAYAVADGLTPTSEIAGDLNARTLLPGIYHAGAAIAVNGVVTLDAVNDPNAVFIFQVDAALGSGATSSLALVNGAQASRVFWQVLGAVTVGANASFSGTILADGAVTIGADAQLIGRAFATGLVTLSSNAVRFTTALPPAVTITGGAATTVKDTTPAISGTTSAALGSAVRVTVAGQVLETTVQSAGTWSVQAAELTAGVKTVVVSVRDAAGNNGSATQQLMVQVNPVPVDLGLAAGFSVLGGTGVTNAGAATSVSGDVGSGPPTPVSGFPPGLVSGTIHAGDAAAGAAQSAFSAAYADADARVPVAEIAGDLVGQTFVVGVYHAAAAITATGTVTLDGEGDPNAVFIFQVDAAMSTGALGQIVLTNGAQASGVFWQVSGAVTPGAGSSFVGTILANGAVTPGDGARLVGRALSAGTVALSNNVIRFTTALPPVVTITGGASATTKDTTPTISGSTDAALGTTVSVSVGGQVLTSVLTTPAWTVEASALSGGTHTVVASVRDAAGNYGKDTQFLTVQVNPAMVMLGAAATFSAFGGTGVTNAGPSMLSGDVGSSLTAAVTGFPPGVTEGTIHAGDAVADSAGAAFQAAYADADTRVATTEIAGPLTGNIFVAGVYHSTAELTLNGTVTLDAENDPDAVFIFQLDAALNTGASSRIALVNGASASRVFWQVLGAVVTGASSSFTGSIMANGAVTMGAGAEMAGRAMSMGTVALSTNVVDSR